MTECYCKKDPCECLCTCDDVYHEEHPCPHMEEDSTRCTFCPYYTKACEEKIIIINRTNLPWDKTFSVVATVMDKGKISETSKGKQFCFLSTFSIGKDEHIAVTAHKNKHSDRFIIQYYQP